MKKLPIGISDFKEIIEEDYYYVDKSLFIDELKRTNGKVILVPRPRRFGKTLNLSMLRYFFEKTEESNEHLFHKLAIWSHEKYRKFQGQHPVIFLSFKAVKSRDFETAYEQIVEIIVEEFNRHEHCLTPTLSKKDFQDYQAILSRKANRALYEKSLFFLTRLLHAYYKKRVFILLDEYDGPLHAAYHYGYYDQLIDFMRSLLTATFKDNSYLERGVLTGILRVAKEGIFSGLNNLRIFTLLDDKFSDKFGFTQSEVDTFLTDFKLLKHKDTIKIWYDGYRCGTTQSLYNPWSFIECVDHKGELIPYWANTSDNALVKKLIARSDESIKTEMEDILSGRSIKKEIQDAIIIPGIEDDPQALWGLLLFAGYVTFENYVLKEGKKWCSLIVPNKEITILFYDLVQQILKQALSTKKIQNLYEALSTGDALQCGELLQEFVINSMSAFDISAHEPEKSYHLFVLGLLVMLADQYHVKSNRESGYGRYDIMLIPFDKKKPGIILEFKKVSTIKPEPLESAAQKALDQIVNKNYAQELKSLGIKTISAFGIAFAGKQLHVVSQVL